MVIFELVVMWMCVGGALATVTQPHAHAHQSAAQVRAAHGKRWLKFTRDSQGGTWKEHVRNQRRY